MIKNYSDDIQQPPRILICGATGSGKTNILLNLLFDILEFDRLYLCAKDLEESKYQKLMQIYSAYADVTVKDIKNLKLHEEPLALEACKKYKKDKTFYCSSQREMIHIDDLDPEFRNVVVFDDCITDKDQSKIVDHFIRGRKKNSIAIYLAQSYYACPITVRRNCNIFVLINLQKRDRERILREIDGNFPNFKFASPYDFIVLNTSTFTKNRYQQNSLNI
jgi:Ni2+-binding GTPase involved in maturation of urease and hydrogenase